MAMQGVYRSQASPTLTALPPGLMGLYTQGAKSLAEGIGGFGEGIADAISSYKEGQAKREFNTKEFEALQEYADRISGKSGAGDGAVEGWGNAFDKSYQEEFAKTISKFNDMSTSQQEGAISGMKFKLSRIEKDRAFEEDKRRSRERESQGWESLDLKGRGQEQTYKMHGEELSLKEESLAERIRQFSQTQDFRERVHTDTTNRNEKQDEWRQEAARNAAEALAVYRQNQLNNDDRLFNLKQGEVAAAGREEALNQRAILMGAGVIPAPSAGNYAPGSPEAQPYQYADAMKSAGNVAGMEFIHEKFQPPPESKVGTEITLSNDQKAVWTSDGQIQLMPMSSQPAGAFSPEFMEFMGEGSPSMNLEMAAFGNDEDYSGLLRQIANIEDHKKASRLMNVAIKTRKALMEVSRADDFKSLTGHQRNAVKTAQLNIDRVNRRLLGEEDQAERLKLTGKIIAYEKEIADIHAKSKSEQPSGKGLFPAGGILRQRFNLDGTFENLNK